jgi:hypothetical protein
MIEKKTAGETSQSFFYVFCWRFSPQLTCTQAVDELKSGLTIALRMLIIIALLQLQLQLQLQLDFLYTN